MAGLADWLEDYRNWRGRQEWEQGKGWQDFFGGDPRAQEQFEKLSGFGTDAGGLVGMIKASHGSPHAFTKFDFSKIGTGEGNQAYGHGLYFGEGFDSPVAKNYSITLANRIPLYKGMKPDSTVLSKEALDAIEEFADNRGDVGRALDMLDATKKPESLQWLKENYKDLSTTPGHLYNVELRWPDAAREAADPLGEHHLLDWDAPLSEQPGIAAKLGFSTKTKDQIHDEYDALVAKHGYYHEMPPEIQAKVEQLQNELNNQVPNLTGEQFYSGNTENDYLHSVLSGKKFSKEQSDYLRDLGIPGIRYLDQASRGAGQGTRNYVMFDDALANIVSRNGVSLSDLLQNQQQLKSLNPTGSVFAGYNPTARASLPLGENLTTLSETMGVSPDELITIYRGVPHDVSTINPGDFITTNQQLAKDYAGTGKVISQKVKASDILDDLNESLGEEYIYRPGLKKLLKK